MLFTHRLFSGEFASLVVFVQQKYKTSSQLSCSTYNYVYPILCHNNTDPWVKFSLSVANEELSLSASSLQHQHRQLAKTDRKFQTLLGLSEQFELLQIKRANCCGC